MRCNNCGWDNPSGSMRCEKCNAPQKDSLVQEPNPVSTEAASGNLHETIKGARPSGHYIDAPNESVKSEASSAAAHSCPFCGYPNFTDTAMCISCKKPLKNNPAEGEPLEDRRPGYNDQLKTTHPGRLKTETPWSKRKELKFSLKQLTSENQIKQTLDYIGEKVILNRGNTISNNPTITSNQQAVISNIDGIWYITDLSSLQTTFIRPGSPVEIKKGDIILLGDSRFEFDL